MTDTSANPVSSAAAGAPGGSFGLVVRCHPPVVEPGQHLVITLSDTRHPTGLLLNNVRLMVRSRRDHTVIYEHLPSPDEGQSPDTIDLLVSSELSYGGYDIFASYPRTDTACLASFNLVPPGFRESIGSFRDAVEMHSQAATLYANNNLSAAVALLGNVSTIYSNLGCYDAGILSCQDLAALSQQGRNRRGAESAVRLGLLNVLAASCSRATAEDEVSLDEEPPQDVSLDDLAIDEWQIREFFEVLGTWHKLTAENWPAEMLLQVFTGLLVLNEHHPFFTSLLSRGLASEQYRQFCRRAIDRLQHQVTTIPWLPELLAHAEDDSEAGKKKLRETVLATDRALVYRSIVPVLARMSNPAQRRFVQVLMTAWPTLCVPVGEEIRLYEEDGSFLTSVPNRGYAAEHFFATSGRQSFHELNIRVMKVGV